MTSFARFLREDQSLDVVHDFMQKHDLDEADVMEYIGEGDRIERVVWDTINPSIKVPKASTLNLPEGDVYALHVTSDPEHWIKQLDHDYNRNPKDAKVIDITLVEGDCLIDDHNYQIPSEDGNKASSWILLTHRETLQEGVDFDVRK